MVRKGHVKATDGDAAAKLSDDKTAYSPELSAIAAAPEGAAKRKTRKPPKFKWTTRVKREIRSEQRRSETKTALPRSAVRAVIMQVSQDLGLGANRWSKDAVSALHTGLEDYAVQFLRGSYVLAEREQGKPTLTQKNMQNLAKILEIMK